MYLESAHWLCLYECMYPKPSLNEGFESQPKLYTIQGPGIEEKGNAKLGPKPHIQTPQQS